MCNENKIKKGKHFLKQSHSALNVVLFLKEILIKKSPNKASHA